MEKKLTKRCAFCLESDLEMVVPSPNKVSITGHVSKSGHTTLICSTCSSLEDIFLKSIKETLEEMVMQVSFEDWKNIVNEWSSRTIPEKKPSRLFGSGPVVKFMLSNCSKCEKKFLSTGAIMCSTCCTGTFAFGSNSLNK